MASLALLVCVFMAGLLTRCGGATSGMVISGADEPLFPDGGTGTGAADDDDTDGGSNGGDSDDGDGDGSAAGYIGIDSYVYLHPTVAGAPSTNDWPADRLLFTATEHTDLTGYAGVHIYITDPRNGVYERVTNSSGLWQYRTEHPGGTRFEVTNPDGIPILEGMNSTVLSTGPTTWPVGDITIMTGGLTEPVQVLVESLRGAACGWEGGSRR